MLRDGGPLPASCYSSTSSDCPLLFEISPCLSPGYARATFDSVFGSQTSRRHLRLPGSSRPGLSQPSHPDGLAFHAPPRLRWRQTTSLPERKSWHSEFCRTSGVVSHVDLAE